MASMLVEDLKKEHALISELLKAVQKSGISSKEAKEKLLSAKKGLLEHLKKEDEKLYPALKKAAEADEAVRKLLDLFAEEMKQVSKFALEFFDRYARDEITGMQFAKDFGKLVASLGIRIRKEENILYKEFEKLMK